MPSDPYPWMLLILAVAAVIGIALWKRRGSVRVTLGDHSVEVGAEPNQESKVQVAENLQLDGVKAGDVAGIKGGDAPEGHTVEVAKGAVIKGSEVGDIVGIKKDSP